ncbi:30S ribosomal protein S20 [Candidatus Peribacteria bacterium]|jgi:small subunit ribosomal protein S20|nr:30S ribosomal protein S20 [Candidatus Peribacteria bacterium]MBT4020783.1 30S ribosomal protein S20 [Candidatus Peribacteria bacterium]MBT4241063.1 30S ribosomal protein S20 [Candidatus Peribacteria bacterium]MBT4474438.1 30S ribosomal protein S20 [Candidatus Peribacteria bacterium]
MPIIKSAIKRVKQTKRRTERLLPYRSHMKTMVKKVMALAKEGKKEEAEKILPEAFKAVDTAAKKNIINGKTADRRKSTMSKAVNKIGK